MKSNANLPVDSAPTIRLIRWWLLPILFLIVVASVGVEIGYCDDPIQTNEPATDGEKTPLPTLEQIAGELATTDPDRQRELVNAVRRHPEWTPQAAQLISGWLSDDSSAASHERELLGLLKAYSHRRLIVEAVDKQLQAADIKAETQLLLLRLIGEACTRRMPSSWAEAIGELLDAQDHSIQLQAVLTLKASGSPRFDERLKTIAAANDSPARLRVSAIHCIAAREFPINDEAFALLTTILTGTDAVDKPLLATAAAFALRDSHLSEPQAIALCSALKKLPRTPGFLVLPAIAKLSSFEVGKALVDGLKDTGALEILTPDDLTRLLEKFPDETSDQAATLLAMLRERDAPQMAKVASIVETLNSGDPEAGKTVFFSDRAACTACHRAANRGGGIGPNLSRIAFFRNRNELQSAVLSPNAAIAFEFRSWIVRTASGKVAAGYLEQQSSAAIYLRTPDKKRVVIDADDIEALELSQRSLMPEGIEKLLTQKELSDLLAFLSRQL